MIPEITPLLISNNQDQQSSGSQYNQFKQDENYDGAEDVKKGTWKVRDYFRSKIHRVPPQQVVTELPVGHLYFQYSSFSPVFAFHRFGSDYSRIPFFWIYILT